MTWTRRRFLQSGSLAALAIGGSHSLGPWRQWRWGQPPRGTLAAEDPTLQNFPFQPLAMAALDAARQAGASYADVRLTYERGRGFPYLSEGEQLGVGVRVVVDGNWGFASSPYCTTDSAVRVGREAVRQAKANADAAAGTIELAPTPKVVNGSWETPITIDPFSLAVEEILDWRQGMQSYVGQLPPRGHDSHGTSLTCDLGFQQIREAFASTDGTYLTQTYYYTFPYVSLGYRDASLGFSMLQTSAQGWEMYADNTQAMRDAIPVLCDMVDADALLPVKPVDVGKYDMVFDRGCMANLLAQTIGGATQLDRALGYEANAGGTSYLGPDPLTFLGTPITSPLLSVTGNRSTPTAMATTKWDSEGVEAKDFTLIEKGTLVDYQTTREQPAWIAPWYKQQGIAPRSHGCARAPSALDLSMQHTPNLAMAPGSAAQDFDELVAAMPKGMAMRGAFISMDQQKLYGFGLPGNLYEVKQGKRVARIGGAGFLFRANELWKNLAAIGGPGSARWMSSGQSVKGEPRQTMAFSVSAVPATVTNVTIIDAKRRA